MGLAKVVRKAMLGVMTIAAVAGASLWLTARALEPEPFGEAIAPDPGSHSGAVIQVYGADVWGLRGRFAMHTWIATKAEAASTYRIFQVIGWRLRRYPSVVSVSEGDPAKPWFGSPPVLLHELRDKPAEALIDRVHEAARSYPFAEEYTMWPGPNSNSFIEWIALEVPELDLSLPTKALGSGWMRRNHSTIKAEATPPRG